MEWKKEVALCIHAFDEALGRPPFPSDASVELQVKAQAVLTTLRHVVDAGRLKTLEGVAEATTTLPILCASLREGSVGRRPALSVYRPLVLATGLASALSTYPVSNLVTDAKAVLGNSVYNDGAEPVGAAAVAAASASPEEVGVNEATLVTFMAATHSLTPDDVRRFLRLPLPTTAPPPRKSGAKQKGGTKGGASPAKANAKAGGGAGGAVVTAASVPRADVSRAVLDAMLEAPLPEDCRLVLESFFDNTPKFLEVVGGNGDLASRILAVYGARIVPKLKPSSLLPCLNAALLDYFVDVVAGTLQARTATLLVSKELREMARAMWNGERVRELARAAACRCVRADAAEALASVVVYAFLYRVACDVASGVTRDAEGSTAPTADSEGWDVDMSFLGGVCRAMQAVLTVDEKTLKSTPSTSHSHAFIQAKTGILVMPANGVPLWLDALSTFAQQFLSRQAAVSLLVASCPTGRKEKESEAPSRRTVDVTDTAQQIEDTLAAVLRTCTAAPPKPETNVAAQKKSEPAKCKVKQPGGDKQTVAGVAESSPAPLALSELLSSCCAVLLLTSLLRQSVVSTGVQGVAASQHPSEQLVCVVFDAYAYVLRHQPQRLSALLWRPCLAFLTLSMWVRRTTLQSDLQEGNTEASSEALPLLLPSAPLDQQVGVLRSATVSTDSVLWLAPLVLVADSTASSRMGSPVSQLFSCDVELWMAVVQAAVNTQNTTPSSPPSPLHACLFPAPATVILGSLCSLLEGDLLQRLADAVVTAASSRSTVLIASLTAMHNADWEAQPPLPSTWLSGAVSMALPQSGLKRLLDVMAILEAGHRAVLQAAEADAKEAAQRAMQAQLAEAHHLAAAHRAFLQDAEGKRAVKTAQQQAVQTEAARRRAERAARLSEDAAARHRKRQNALATLRARESQTIAQREAARRARFDAYQQRLHSAYRVAHFLEHLNLSSSRVMATQDALRSVVDTITPDELLEYLVTGVAKVPLDMLEDSEEMEEMKRKAEAEAAAAVAAAAAAAASKPRHTGERRDFWAEIMDHPEAVEKEEAASVVPTVRGREAAAPNSSSSESAAATAPPPQSQSFHRRVSPLLDLFFYEDGDEFGKVPAVLPSVHIRLAASVWPPARTRELGFANLREAFEAMQRRGLVRVVSGTAQLTLLGFRYHFPYHDPDGMLEVYLREARERVRAAVARQGSGAAAGAAGDSGDESIEEDEEEDWEEGEGWSGEEGEEECGGDVDRLLPEVEFGI